ncbi:MAG: DUF92 domain-containing protein [Acidobacteriota bacterium]|nr:DUF92 domain-containing protein [Acidobacteriota bacterium]
MNPEGWLYLIPQLIPVAALTAAVALCGWAIRAITAGAALTGFVLTVVLCAAAGPSTFFPIAAVFLLTLLCTRIGRRKKERLGMGEHKGGRGALQILANVGVPALCVAPLLFAEHARYALMAAAAAALAEAAGDTVSSELGQVLGGRPRLITTLRHVPAGQDGGISPLGTIASVTAILIVCMVCQWSGLLLPRYLWTAFTAAFFGTVVDSLLGATLERPGRLGNNSVNFSSSACAAGLTLAIVLVQRWL